MSRITYAGTLYFVHWLGIKELELFLFFYSPSLLWCLCGHFVPVPVSGPLQLKDKSDTTPLCMRVRVWMVCLCFQCVLKPFVSCSPSSRAAAYRRHSTHTHTHILRMCVSSAFYSASYLFIVVLLNIKYPKDSFFIIIIILFISLLELFYQQTLVIDSLTETCLKPFYKHAAVLSLLLSHCFRWCLNFQPHY